jgi:hypothetical protein
MAAPRGGRGGRGVVPWVLGTCLLPLRHRENREAKEKRSFAQTFIRTHYFSLASAPSGGDMQPVISSEEDRWAMPKAGVKDNEKLSLQLWRDRLRHETPSGDERAK